MRCSGDLFQAEQSLLRDCLLVSFLCTPYLNSTLLFLAFSAASPLNEWMKNVALALAPFWLLAQVSEASHSDPLLMQKTSPTLDGKSKMLAYN